MLIISIMHKSELIARTVKSGFASSLVQFNSIKASIDSLSMSFENPDLFITWYICQVCKVMHNSRANACRLTFQRYDDKRIHKSENFIKQEMFI